MGNEKNKTEFTPEEEKWGVIRVDNLETHWEVKGDIVEVVRCKDCVWYDEKRPYANGHTLYECRNLERFFPSDFFCKDGKRKKE